MNIPRQPNARPGAAPFLGQSLGHDVPPAPSTSFLAPFVLRNTTAAVESTGNAKDERSTNHLVPRGS
jgi:hypothetical protein